MADTQTAVLEGDDALEKFLRDGELEEAKQDLDFSELLSETKEETTTTEEKPETVTTKAEESNTTVDELYTNKLQEYIEEGFFVDGEIEIEDENGEPQVILLSEMKGVTPEMFEAIKAEQKRVRDEDIKSKYISTEGLDENTKKLIELKKAGGDITPLLQVEAQYVNPVQNLDLDNEQHQEYLVRESLKAQNLKPKVIDAQIEAMKEDMTLDMEAKKLYDDVNKKYGEFIDQKKKEVEEQLEGEKTRQKEFKKSMSETIKGLKLEENLQKTILENTAKFDENGLTNTDSLYFQAKKNPELYAKLALFLTDEKKFNDFMGVKIKNEVKLDTVKSIFKLNPKTISTKEKEVKQKDKSTDPLEEFLETNK